MKQPCILVRMVKLLVYGVSALFCFVSLMNTLSVQHGVGKPFFTFFFLVMTFGLFGAVMYQTQEAQREWIQDLEQKHNATGRLPRQP